MPKKFTSLEEKRTYYREAMRRWYARNPKHYLERYRKDRAGYISRSLASLEKHRDKHNTRVSLRYAVSRGWVKKPKACSRCRSVTKITAHHHHGYDREHRYDVEWLCCRCHGLEHRIEKRKTK